MTLDNAIAAGGIVGEITVLALLCWRGSWRKYPLFFTYCIWTLASDAVGLVAMARFPGVYQKVYFYQLIPDTLLQLGVIVELAWTVLKPSRSILPRGTLYIFIGLVLLAGLAIWPLASMAIPSNLPSKDAEIFFHFQGTISILRIVCFLVIAGFSQLLSIGWRDREVQIATGLGFFSMVSLIVTVLHSHLDSTAAMYDWLDLVPPISYVGTLAYWVLAFSTKEQERREFSPQMRQFLLQMGGASRTGRIALTDLPPRRSEPRD